MSKAYKEMKNSLYSQGFYTKRTLGRKNPVPKGCVVLQIGYKKYDIKGHELRQKTKTLQLDEIERRRDSDEDMHSHAIKMGSSSFKKEHDSSDESEIPSDSENSDDNINKQ